MSLRTFPRVPLVRHALLFGLVWASLEVLLLLFRPGYPFPRPWGTTGYTQLLDTWVYASFQWDMAAQMREFGSTYYASRVSVFLPGAILHWALPPSWAVLAYKLLFSALTAASWAFVCYHIAGIRAALAATVMGVLTPWLIVIRHNDYVDQGVVLYGSLALAAIVGTGRLSCLFLWRMAAGFALGSMVVANLGAGIALGPAFALFYFLQAPGHLLQQLRGCLGIFVGFALALGVFSMASFVMGGPAWVLRSQVNAMLSLGSMAKNPWAPDAWGWLAAATWLVLPAAALLWGGLALCSSARISTYGRRMLLALTAAHAVACGSLLLLEWRGVAALYLYYYAVYLLVFSVPLLALGATALPKRSSLLSSLIVLAAFILILVFGAWGEWLAGVQDLLGFSAGPGALAVGLALLGVLVFVSFLPRWPAWCPPVLAAFVVLCATPMGFNDARYLDRLREHYLLVHRAFQEILLRFPGDSCRFWLDAQAGSLGVPLASANLFDYRLLTAKGFPEREQTAVTDRTIIVPTLPGHSKRLYEEGVARNPDMEFSPPTVMTVPGEAGLALELLCFSMRERTADPEAPGHGEAAFRRLIDLRSEQGSSYASRLDKMIYQGDPALAVVGGPDFPRFKRTDERDHLATGFFELPPGVGNELLLVMDLAESAPARCVVQTGGFQSVREIALQQPGRQVYRVLLPVGAKSVRLVFKSDSNTLASLPKRVSLYAPVGP